MGAIFPFRLGIYALPGIGIFIRLYTSGKNPRYVTPLIVYPNPIGFLFSLLNLKGIIGSNYYRIALGAPLKIIFVRTADFSTN